MEKTMTASGISDDQIAAVKNQLGDALHKHRVEITEDDMKRVLDVLDLGTRLYEVILEFAQEIGKQIICTRIVEVNRARAPQESFMICGRKLFLDKRVVNAIPRGVGDSVKLIYFKPRVKVYNKDGWLTPQALEEEYQYNGLVPDPQAQIDDNAANPEFADNQPNACQFCDADSNHCSVTFNTMNDGRVATATLRSKGWGRYWIFAGVSK